MTTPSVAAPVLPPPVPIPTSPDFDHIPWWTTPHLSSVLDRIDPTTWSLLSELVTDPTAVPEQQLHSGGPAILRLMAALWMRRPLDTHIPTAAEIPDHFTPLLTTLPAAWRALGPTAAAWCLARAATFARHLHHPAHDHTGHHLDDLARVAWRLLTEDDGSYLYTAALAARYDSDRPHDPEYAEALTTLARTTLADRDVVELGAGTGAITTITAPHTHSLVAIEPAVGMREVLTRRTGELDQVQVIGQDCMNLELPDASADTVFEHAALCFVDEPLFAIAEIRRVLRPGGALVRIIPSYRPPEIFTTFAAEFHAELRRLGHPRGRIVSSGNDARITDWLATAAIDTRFDTLATWTSTHPLHHHTAPLLNGSYPYLAEVSAEHRRHALETALAATHLDPDTPITTTNAMSTATSSLGQPHPDPAGTTAR
ncbi:class I SAM-dependent methyltransferase [Nocardia noduli]|uniref:class I SAM-dependent methyltransferase n=1 Tax=Nocardia noduli TaxID=2815722 RepID=UPI001C218866|nr:class I SAM-dependent methyltransferase [Nocardia noduli]